MKILSPIESSLLHLLSPLVKKLNIKLKKFSIPKSLIRNSCTLLNGKAISYLITCRNLRQDRISQFTSIHLDPISSFPYRFRMHCSSLRTSRPRQPMPMAGSVMSVGAKKNFISNFNLGGVRGLHVCAPFSRPTIPHFVPT